MDKFTIVYDEERHDHERARLAIAGRIDLLRALIAEFGESATLAEVLRRLETARGFDDQQLSLSLEKKT